MTVQRRGAAVLVGLVVAVCSAVATFTLHRVFVATEVGQAADQALLEQAAALPAAAAAGAEAMLSLFTPVFVLLACAVPPLIALVRRSAWHATAAVVLVGGANITTQVLKEHVFERPDLLALGAPNSLPSGHTTVAASIALGLVLIAPRALRAPVAVLGLAGSLLVGAATILAGWHRLSDVVAALLVCTAWAGLVLAALALRPRHPRRPRRHRGPAPAVTEPTARRAPATAHR